MSLSVFTFALIRSFGKDVYIEEKPKEDTWEPWRFRRRNFSMTSEEFLMDKKIYRAIA